MTQTYDQNIDNVFKQMKNNRFFCLGYIDPLFRTKEVCLAAVKSESKYTYALNNFNSVPMGNLDYVMNNMRIIKKKSSHYIKELEAAYLKRKPDEQKAGYYGVFKNYQELLNHQKATDYDDMSRKRYIKATSD